jgi:hypothetical protein
LVGLFTHIRTQLMFFKPKSIDEPCLQTQHIEGRHKKGQPEKMEQGESKKGGKKGKGKGKQIF